MRLIETDADIAEGLEALCAGDSLLRAMREVAGPVPLRRSAAGFAGLTRIVMGQQLSVAAADAISRRLEARLTPFTAQTLLGLHEQTLRDCGLSRPKVTAMRAISQAIVDDRLDLDGLPTMPARAAHAHLTAVKGIGPWTADIYMLLCIGHADIFPAGDLALQIALQQGAGLSERPDAKALAAWAGRWSPWRGVAARLLWAYYRATRQAKSGAPI